MNELRIIASTGPLKVKVNAEKIDYVVLLSGRCKPGTSLTSTCQRHLVLS